MARIHQAVPRGATQGASIRVPAFQPKIRTPLCKAVLKLLGGRTATAIAKDTGLSDAGVSRLLRGERDARGTTILKVSRVLGCTMEELLSAVTQGAEHDERLQDTRGLLARVRRGGLD